MTPFVANIMRIDEEIRMVLKYELPTEIENPNQKGGEEYDRPQISME